MAGALIQVGWLRAPSLQLCADECGARCCKHRMVLLSEEEARALKALAPTPSLIARGSDGRWAMLTTPACMFLMTDATCLIYTQRPAACRAFPQHPSAGCLVWPKDA